MGVADSPLRNRVLFVQGAPRSGTTWLSAVLATHPGVAGILSESHLFDRGVNHLFDNFEGSGPTSSFLASYLSRPALVDLVRDLCDGVFLSVREAVKPDAELVMEKTPFGFHDPWVELRRKLETYPDAWYLHIVRDGDQVVRSLLRTPFAAERTPDECLQMWRNSVAAARELIAGHPRYCEVDYRDLRADPVGAIESVIGWLGLPFSSEDRARVARVSEERFAQFTAPAPGTSALGPLGLLGLRARDLARRGVGRARRTVRELAASPASATPAALLLRTAREREMDDLRAVTAEDFVLELRSAGGDLHATGEPAREALCDLLATLVANHNIAEAWSNPLRPTALPVEFIAIGGDGTRHDVAFHVTSDGERVSHLKVISASDPATRRPMKQWAGD